MCASSLSKVFGTLIASGIIATMDGILGYAAWRWVRTIQWLFAFENSYRWLFFIEGGLTCMIAIPAFYLVPDFPTTPASWLTVDEQMLAQTRMVEDLHGLERKETQQSGLIEAFSDWKVWWLAIALTILDVALSFGDFFPTLVATLGYNETTTLLLCAPPWVLGVLTSLLIMRFVIRFFPFLPVIDFLTDIQIRHGIVSGIYWVQSPWVASGFCLRSRQWTLPFATWLCEAASLFSHVLVSHEQRRFFMTQSTVTYVVSLAWVSNSIPEPPAKQAVALAFVNVLVGLGSVGTP